MGNSTKELKELADAFRGAADILDEVVTNLEDEAISDVEKEKKQDKQDKLTGRFMRQMLKIQQLQS